MGRALCCGFATALLLCSTQRTDAHPPPYWSTCLRDQLSAEKLEDCLQMRQLNVKRKLRLVTQTEELLADQRQAAVRVLRTSVVIDERKIREAIGDVLARAKEIPAAAVPRLLSKKRLHSWIRRYLRKSPALRQRFQASRGKQALAQYLTRAMGALHCTLLKTPADAPLTYNCTAHTCAGSCLAEHLSATVTQDAAGLRPPQLETRFLDDGSCGCCNVEQ